MNKKDILFLCQFFYPENVSSATLPFDTAKYLANSGFSVDALVGYPKEYSDIDNVPKKETKDGVNIKRIGYVQLDRNKKLSRIINYLSFTISAMCHLFKLRKYKYVVVYSNPPILPIVPIFANMLFKTKIVFVAYDIYPEVAYASNSIRKGNVIDRGMKWINKLLYKRVYKVVSLTDEMKEFILENRSEITEDRIVTIANWAHEKKVEPKDEYYENFGYKPGQFIVSYFGNMGICQEMDTLINTVEQLKNNEDIRFLFIGHGKKQPGIRKRFEDQNLKNVQMLDFMTGDKFGQAVAISSCCVVSLEKGLKGMCAPSKFYSYLQGGKAILGIVEKDSYLEKEINKEKLGKVINIMEIDKLVDCILNLSNSKRELQVYEKNSLNLYLNKYTFEKGMEKYYKIFK